MTLKEVKFGLMLPGYVSVTKSPPSKRILEFARTAERLGFESLWTSDVTTVRASRSYLEPLLTLCFVASVTSKVRLGTSVLVLPLINPVLLAKEVATMNYLFPGRIVLGVGIGHFKGEMNAVSIPFHERGERTEEALKILRMLWSGDKVSYHGKYYAFDEASIGLRGEKGYPRILMGGKVDRALKRTALLGDGWIGAAYNTTPQVYRDCADKIKAYAKSAGRNLTGFEWVVSGYTYSSTSKETALKESVAYFKELYGGAPPPDVGAVSIMGSPKDCVKDIESKVRAGAETIILILLAKEDEQMELFSNEVIPHFTKK